MSETNVKNKLNRRDAKIAKLADLAYRRLTFGPHSTVGLPDRLVSFGTCMVGVEVKDNGKKITRKQQHELDNGIKHGVPSMPVIGDAGVDNYYRDLREWFTPDAVEARMIQYERDSVALYATLDALVKEQEEE